MTPIDHAINELACSAGVFFERVICSRKRHVETSRREEEMGRVKGSGEGAEREKRNLFFSPLPSPLSFFRPRTYRKGYYFYSPQSSTVIKSKMATTTILRTLTRFRPPKIRLHCRLLTKSIISYIINTQYYVYKTVTLYPWSGLRSFRYKSFR